MNKIKLYELFNIDRGVKLLIIYFILKKYNIIKKKNIIIENYNYRLFCKIMFPKLKFIKFDSKKINYTTNFYFNINKKLVNKDIFIDYLSNYTNKIIYCDKIYLCPWSNVDNPIIGYKYSKNKHLYYHDKYRDIVKFNKFFKYTYNIWDKTIEYNILNKYKLHNKLVNIYSVYRKFFNALIKSKHVEFICSTDTMHNSNNRTTNSNSTTESNIITNSNIESTTSQGIHSKPITVVKPIYIPYVVDNQLLNSKKQDVSKATNTNITTPKDRKTSHTETRVSHAISPKSPSPGTHTSVGLNTEHETHLGVPEVPIYPVANVPRGKDVAVGTEVIVGHEVGVSVVPEVDIADKVPRTDDNPLSIALGEQLLLLENLVQLDNPKE